MRSMRRGFSGLRALMALCLCASAAVAGPVECIKAGVEFVYVDFGVYQLTETLSIPSNVTIYCAPGAVFEAAPGAFKGIHDVLIELKGTKNAIHHCTFRMRRDEYTEANGYPPSEWRHTISLAGASDIYLGQIHADASGGDGVFIGPLVTGSYSEDRKPCQRITIDHLTAAGNYRTGVAITSCVDCAISDSVFSDTKGVSTSAGLLIEPDHGGDRAANISVKRSTSRNNAGSAFRVNLNKQNQNSQAVSITFTDCKGEMVPRGHELMQVDEFNWNLNAVKPKGFIRWDRSSWENP